ncbi:hypothetical protein VTK56DRAFT_5747 [Thermocarpiscus australiensis]
MHVAMGDPREYSDLPEEKTEPFSQSEIEARLHRSRMEEFNAMNSTVPLDQLVVPQDQDIRILLRPLARGRSVSPAEQENCKWLALHAEMADQDESQHKVLAVTQTARDIRFTVTIPDVRPGCTLWCELYYDPASDNQILINRSDVPFTLTGTSRDPPDSPGEQYELKPNFNKALAPGTWRIRIDGTDVLDFRIIEKRPARLRGPSSSSSSNLSGTSDLVNASGKRSFVADEDEPLSPEKRRRPSDTATARNGGNGVIVFRPEQTSRLVFPLPTAEKGKELSTSGNHPLLDMEPGETLEVPRGAELIEYAITKKEPIASTSLSSVFTAKHSNIPAGMIVVKVLKTRSPASANNEGAVSRDVIRQADIWLRELRSQENLHHKSIVRLYGGDARYLSLYMEHVDARDLSTKGTWRAAETDLFAGDRSDAWRILRDIASGLHYIHSKGVVHNDIKPGNILYSRERGAVLCDLGLSTKARDPVTAGGTPWYVPPEFIGMKQRGAPSDVWALGVTMLYVLGKISWPDVRGHKAHPRHLFWQIAKVNSRDRGPQAAAVSSMRQWLNEVNSVRSGLDTRDKLERLVHGMLAPNPKERVTTKEIVGQAFVEQAA